MNRVQCEEMVVRCPPIGQQAAPSQIRTKLILPISSATSRYDAIVRRAHCSTTTAVTGSRVCGIHHEQCRVQDISGHVAPGNTEADVSSAVGFPRVSNSPLRNALRTPPLDESITCCHPLRT
jgi:hypothetical protein